MNLTIANEIIKRVRKHRRLSSRELAKKANVSAAEISLIERQMRSPGVAVLQKIAAALEVSTSYLLQETNTDLPIDSALAVESFQIFLRRAKIGPEQIRRLREIVEHPSAPQSVKGWEDLVANISLYQSQL